MPKVPIVCSSMAGADVQLVKFVMSCLNEQSVAHPDGLVTQLNDLLRQSKLSAMLALGGGAEDVTLLFHIMLDFFPVGTVLIGEAFF